MRVLVAAESLAAVAGDLERVLWALLLLVESLGCLVEPVLDQEMRTLRRGWLESLCEVLCFSSACDV